MAQAQSDATTRSGKQTQGQGELQRDRQRYQTSREDRFLNPFALLGRLADEMTGVFANSGLGRTRESSAAIGWAPEIDVLQRGNELVVRADLPGVKPDDVDVEISDDAITISGERSDEREEERHGVYRVERRYGSFFRTIPLPQGAIADQAKARFNDGVLEVVVPAPSEQVSRGRRIPIEQGPSQQQRQK